uniref:Uncharacterized protein n=1 Tax=Zea mays TaxID=4577 RepID=C4J8L2_MAIZE|nr:unknown [Zea mays]
MYRKDLSINNVWYLRRSLTVSYASQIGVAADMR